MINLPFYSTCAWCRGMARECLLFRWLAVGFGARCDCGRVSVRWWEWGRALWRSLCYVAGLLVFGGLIWFVVCVVIIGFGEGR